MAIQRFTERDTIYEGQPINIAALVGTFSRIMTKADITAIKLRVVDTSEGDRVVFEKPLLKDDVFFNSVQTSPSYLPGGWNFFRSVAESEFPGGHSGGHVYEVQVLINTTDPTVGVLPMVATITVLALA